ncbi:MAG TPA: ATP-NAD kinase family protein [Candidatus Methanofastidiosa archaeon]|nr:ATP-NAD kinase family protein [Candidatus Methanofastidiosa archaeon]HPR41492.1 ATP-NAD kinase family protein [Candidatus Methanofastidiosa archaeon]
MLKIGFLVNPIAGMGGKVGLKGTDNMSEAAMRLGAKNVSFSRAALFLSRLPRDVLTKTEWLTCAGPMGSDILNEHVDHVIVYEPHSKTTSEDTLRACSAFLRKGCDLIVFCGGDGTARDVYSVVGSNVVLLGIPSGVKMLSGVFAINPEAAADILELHANGQASIRDAEIVDLDEEEYRRDTLAFKVFGIGRTVFEGNYMQSSKMLVRGPEEEEIKEDIARTLIEDLEDNTLYLLGAGSTLMTIGRNMGIDKTLLGIDAFRGGAMVGKDLNESGLKDLLKEHAKVKLILSPIGAQGFIIGRGNQQLSPAVISAIGLENILIVSTPAKLGTIKRLLVDTGDAHLDDMFNKKRYLPVIIGYRTSTIKNIGIANLK